jgi:glucose/arabinose dehydrogenase
MRTLSRRRLRVPVALTVIAAGLVAAASQRIPVRTLDFEGVGFSAPASSQPEVQTVATGLAVPWGVAFLPDGNALVSERDSARLLNVTPSGEVTEVGTIAGVVPGGEGGLLGVAVSPNFATDHHVYLYYTAASDNRIVRVPYEGGQLGAQEVLVSGIPAGLIHNGGSIAFGPDGMLYAGTGESGNTDLAQDLSSLGGKILRMTPEGEPAPGNPFGTLIWTYGHRNVQGLAWDPAGRMYATELGQNAFDEINRIEPGSNYGWPIVEGPGGGGSFTDPLLTWTTDEASPSGAAILAGSLWVAALRGQRLWQVPLTEDGDVGAPEPLFTGEFGRLRAVAVAPDGTLWVTTSNRDGRGTPVPEDDRILSITPETMGT